MKLSPFNVLPSFCPLLYFKKASYLEFSKVFLRNFGQKKCILVHCAKYFFIQYHYQHQQSTVIMVNFFWNLKIYFSDLVLFLSFYTTVRRRRRRCCVQQMQEDGLCDQNCIYNCWNTRQQQNVATSIWPLYMCPTE